MARCGARFFLHAQRFTRTSLTLPSSRTRLSFIAMNEWVARVLYFGSAAWLFFRAPSFLSPERGRATTAWLLGAIVLLDAVRWSRADLSAIWTEAPRMLTLLEALGMLSVVFAARLLTEPVGVDNSHRLHVWVARSLFLYFVSMALFWLVGLLCRDTGWAGGGFMPKVLRAMKRPETGIGGYWTAIGCLVVAMAFCPLRKHVDWILIRIWPRLSISRTALSSDSPSSVSPASGNGGADPPFWGSTIFPLAVFLVFYTVRWLEAS